MYTFESMIAALLGNNETDISAYFSNCYKDVSKSIKVFQRKISLPHFFEITAPLGWTFTDPGFIKDNSVYYITRTDQAYGLGKHRLHGAGFFYMQEMAASIPANFLDITAGDIVLDMCAAPGGKSVQIADKGGYVVSNEVSHSRIVALQSNLNRMGVYNSTVTSIQGGQRGNMVPGFFDHVLVDAPCSGEGTGFKSDAGTKWRREESIHKIARTQKEILISAIKACKVGGTIIYSTCTINPWENEWIVHDILQHFQDNLVLENVDAMQKSAGITQWEGQELLSPENAQKVARYWPHIQQTGGFFIAKFRKIGAVEGTAKPLGKKSISQLDVSDKLQIQISDFLEKEYGVTIDPSTYFFVSSQKQVYLTSPIYKHIHEHLFTEKTGVPILKRDNNKQLIPLHGLGNCLGNIATKNIIHLAWDVLQQYSEGVDIPVLDSYESITSSSKYAILQRDNYGFSVGKIVNGFIKNKFSK